MDEITDTMTRSIENKIKLVRNLVAEIGLDLSGLTVLTELASKDFMLAPVIASIAGAKDVRLWGRDTRYGKAKDLAAELENTYRQANLAIPTKIRINERVAEDIQSANIVTNSGMLRPLDAAFLSKMAASRSVVSLMYDAWELRDSDLDIDACRAYGVEVVGVNENDKDFPIFEFCGPLAAKMLFDAGYEVLGSRVIIWSNDDFGNTISAYLENMGAASVFMTMDQAAAELALTNADVIIFAKYTETRTLVASDSDALFSLQRLAQLNPHLGIVHLYGKIDAADVRNAGFSIHPNCNGLPLVMSHTLADLGSLPVLKLIIAGLRAAQEVLRNEELRFAQKLFPLETS